MKRFYRELQRRNVIKASISYLVVAWLILQVASIVFPILGLSPVIQKWILIVLAIGFPAWVIFAYIYELTPQGFRKTDNVAPEESIRTRTNKKLNAYIIAGLSLVVIALLFDRFFQVDVYLETDQNRDKSVAILPFNNLSAVEDKYFTAGMTQDILTQISQIGDLRVLSDFTINNYDFEGKSPEIMGEELGVSYILTGNVRRSDDNLRISCQLVGTNNEGSIWAKSYDKRMTNMFDLQAEIATEIANTLAASLSDEEKEQLEQKPTDNLVAYDIYLRARDLSKQFSKPEDQFKAIELLHDAIRLDSTFSWGYSSLASTYIFGIQDFGIFPGNYLDTALVLAQQGVDLGPEFSGTWNTLGSAYSSIGKREQAAAMYKKALKINPNSASAVNNLSVYYSAIGALDKSIDMYKKSITIKPKIDSTLTINYSNLAHVYRRVGLLNEAIFCGEEAVKYREYSSSLLALGTAQFMFRDTINAFKTLGKIAGTDNRSVASLATATNMFYEYGDQKLGLAYLEELKQKEVFRWQDFTRFRIYDAIEFQKAGKYDSAEVFLEESLEFYLSQFERGRRFNDWLYDISLIYIAQGKEVEAFEWLEKLIDGGFTDYDQIHESILYDPIKDHPEYKRIMGKLRARLDIMKQKVLDQEATEQLKGISL